MGSNRVTVGDPLGQRTKAGSVAVAIASDQDPLDVEGPLTDDQLRASPVDVAGPLTDAELRAVAVPVSGTFWQATQPVSGPLTDAELRATDVPVTGPLTDAQLRATDVPVSGPLTDTELRASPVDVTGPLTDTELRAAAVEVDGSGVTQPVSAAALPLPLGAATAAKQPALGTAGSASADVLTVQGKAGMTPVLVDGSGSTQPVSGPLTDTELRASPVDVAGPLTDAELRASPIEVDGSGATQPVSAAALPLPAGASTEAKQDDIISALAAGIDVTVTNPTADPETGLAKDATLTTTNTEIGATNEAAAGSDTATAGLNGRLQRIAQRLTTAIASLASILAKLPAFGTAGSASADVVSVQGVASMTAVKTDGSGVTQPVSGTVTANAGTNLDTSALATESGGNLAAAATSLAVIDDWDESDRAKVNPIAGQAGVQGGSGSVSALTQRVVLATDVALPAGTNVIGKLAANSGVDIGDVDVASLPSIPAGNNNIGDVDIASVASGTQIEAIGDVAHDALGTSTNPVLTGGYASAAAPSDVSGDGDAVRSWHLRNGAQAAVLTAAGALIGGDASNGLDVDVTRLPALVAGTANIGDVDVLTLPADPLGANADAIVAAGAAGSISAKLRRTTQGLEDLKTGIVLAAGSAAIGKLAANSGVDIGDVDVTTVGTITPGTAATSLGKAEDAQHASGDVGVMALAVRKATAVDLSAGNSDGDYEPLQVDANGRLHVIASSGVAGDIAHDSSDSGNPVKIGGKARTALPTAVAAGDRTDAATDTYGRLLTAHIDPGAAVHKAFNATTTQTGTDVWSPTSGKKIAVTSVIIGTYGTTAARVILWFGDNADTTYTAGTDQVLLAASFAPSATLKPGLVYTPSFPIFCTTADRELHITTDAAMSIDVTVEGYEWV